MHKKYHEKFKILDILAVTTQAREGIETVCRPSNKIPGARPPVEKYNCGKLSLCGPNSSAFYG